MARGFFIGMGDRTRCGGKVLAGHNLLKMFGMIHSQEGDPVTCGQDGRTYRILGGVPFIRCNGRLVAGSLDSVSGCDCRATLLPSVGAAQYQSANSAPMGLRAAATHVAPVETSLARSSAESMPQHFAVPGYRNRGEEPGFHILEKSMSRDEVQVELMILPRSQAALDKFHALNPASEMIKAGSIIVLSDPNNQRCTREEAMLMAAAASVNEALESLTPEEADFMMRHRQEIATFMGEGSTVVGVAQVMLAQHLSDVSQSLKDLEALHQRSFLRDGHLRSPQFFAERKILLSQLDVQLNSLTRKGIGLPEHPNLKSALGISSRSLVHHWSKAGAPGQIPGYATHVKEIAKASKFVSALGWIGITVGAGGSYNKVQAVCAAGNAQACERVKFTEAGSFTGGLAGGTIGATATGLAAASICVAMGLPTLGTGTVACGLVLIGAGSLGGGWLGEKFGEGVGELIYRGRDEHR